MDNNNGENPGGGGEGADAPAAVDNVDVDVDALVAAAKAEGIAEGSARPWEGWTVETEVASVLAGFAFRGVVHELSNVATLSTIKGLVEDHPVVMTFKDHREGHKGWGIMHYAAHHSAPREVIEYLATKDPLALMQKSANGLLPLHVALRSGAEYQTVVGITLAWRGALLAISPKGNTPLHMAAGYATDPKVVHFLASAEPKALEMANQDMGYLPLHEAVARERLSPPFPGTQAPTENLPIVETLIDLLPGAMQVPTVEEGANAFHVAAKYGSTAMLEFLRDKYLQAGCTVLWKEDRNGLVPLHWAALANNREVVEWLADQYRPALKATTKNGDLPMHLAAKDSNLEVNQLLVERYPEGVRKKAKDGAYPLHRSAQENKVDVIQFFVGLTPDLVRETTADGFHMLHLAAKSNENEASVRFIYDLNPDAVRAVSKDGAYPVHCAAMTGTLASTELLAEAYSDALVVPNCEGLLPYHVAAEGADDDGTEGLDVMYYLLKKKPDAIFGPPAAASGAAAGAPQQP